MDHKIHNDEERDRLAVAAMRAYRRLMTPSLSDESVRHLWATQERERAAWRAVVAAVLASQASDDTTEGGPPSRA